jgi:nucleotide-binding universal stress UspA family protein
MKIICGTDFSDRAARGTTAAAVLAGKLQDRLLLVHALPGGGLGASSPQVMNAPFASLHEKLAEEVERLGRLGAEIEPHLVTEFPEQAILSKVALSETRLVVIGSQGRLVSNRRLVGGVAERVAESSPVPTLVVRQAEPFGPWVRDERALKVLCTYDFTATADAALTYLNELRRWGRCDLVVAQVDWPPEQKARLGFPGPGSFDGNEPEIQRILERDLREKVNATLGDDGAHICVSGAWGRPDYDLIKIANQEQADLIVTGAHQWRGLARLFHMSVSRALLRYAPTNVLVVPATRQLMKTPPTVPRRVLVATDFSKAGNQAACEAHSLLGAGGILRLVHVTDLRATPRGDCAQDSRDRHAQHLRSCADRLRSLVPAEAAARGIVTEVEVLEHRKPALAIAQAAERFGADVICLGTHGRSRLSVAVSDSVTQTVMRCSARPLLVVHARPE